MVYPALLPLMRPPWLPAVDWTNAPADLNRLIRFAERRNWFLSACHHISNAVCSSGCRRHHLRNTQNIHTRIHTHTQTKIHYCRGFRTRNPINQAAADLRLRPHGHRDRPNFILAGCFISCVRGERRLRVFENRGAEERYLGQRGTR
jgi:hypothetical protein